MFANIVCYHRVFESVDSLTYQIPEHVSLNIGDIVKVPFGTQVKRGIVVSLSENTTLQEYKQIIEKVENQVLSALHIELAKDLSYYYCVSLYRFIQLFLPEEMLDGDYKPTSEFFIQKGTSWNMRFDLISPRAKKQLKHLEIIEGAAIEKISFASLKAEGITLPDLKKLDALEIIEIIECESLHAPYLDYKKRGKVSFDLNPAQKEACQHILGNTTKPQLLFGITGSGKTEVYIRAIQNILSDDPSAQIIMLVPEINLTPQLISRFRDYFDDLSIWHSRLGRQEKLDEWRKIAKGHTRIIIGSRSALFTPVVNLKAIFMDEEHDGSYKQSQTPRYDCHTVTEKIQKLQNIHLVYGSATPKIETYHKALHGIYGLSELPMRFEDRNLPSSTIVDLTQEKLEPKSFLSYPLQLGIQQTLERKEQVLLFLNKRGFANSLTCKNCGWFHECTDCDVSTTMHVFNDRSYLTCHCCGKHYQTNICCPKCESLSLFPLGSGTQKIEEELKIRYPNARILRIDQDTTRGKNAHRDVYELIHKHEVDIIIGTQMIGKGLDIPGVTLVGIILADYGLHVPDFRAEEQSFQTLSQVSGRAGRQKPGKVIIQTFSPYNPVVTATQQHDYKSMYQKVISDREIYNYPPFQEIVKLEMVHPIFETCKSKAQQLAEALKKKIQEDSKISILGPSPALVVRQHNKFHYHILVKYDLEYPIEEFLKTVPNDWVIDRNPYTVV